MYRPSLTSYICIYPLPRDWSWKPTVDWNFGESTHFVHLDESNPEYGRYEDGCKPLSREWSADFHWLGLYCVLTWTIPIEENSDE